MEFCPECDALLVLDPKQSKPGKPVFKCRDCNYSSTDESIVKEYIITEEIPHSEKERVEIIEGDDNFAINPELREELTEQYRESLEGFEY